MNIIPVERLAQPTDAFRCAPYASVITVRTCLARRGAVFAGGRMKGHAPTQHAAFPECVRCALGARVAAQVPQVDTTPRCHCGAPVLDAGKRTPLCKDHRRATERTRP